MSGTQKRACASQFLLNAHVWDSRILKCYTLIALFYTELVAQQLRYMCDVITHKHIHTSHTRTNELWHEVRADR